MVNIKLVIFVGVLMSLLLPLVMAQTFSNNVNSDISISSNTETKDTNTYISTNIQNLNKKEENINQRFRTGPQITYVAVNERGVNAVNTTPNRTINRTPPPPPPPIPPRNITPNGTNTTPPPPPIPPRNVTPNGTNTTFPCTNGTHSWYIATLLANGSHTSSTGAIIPPGRVITPSARLCGDVDGNGRVTIADALRLQQILAGRVYFAPGICADCSNVDGIGSLTSADVRRIALMALGLARGNCPLSCR